jgi:hypothetical protein
MLGRRILTDSEKDQVMEHWHYQCYICRGDIINMEQAEFVHITPLDQGGSFALTNYAPIHDYCYVKAGEQELDSARSDNQIGPGFSPDFDQIFSGQRTEPMIHIDPERMVVVFDNEVVRLYQCPNTSTYYFYHLIPMGYLQGDRGLPKRPMRRSRVVDLAEHMEAHVQMEPVVCRYEQGHLFVVSGHHRATAQYLGNKNLKVDCKVLIGPDIQMLERALEATHSNLRASARRSSPFSRWLQAEYGDEIAAWQEFHPDDTPTETRIFSEALNLPDGQARRAIESFYGDLVIEQGDMAAYLSRIKMVEVPLSESMLNSLIKALIQSEPQPVELEGDADKRPEEADNLQAILAVIRETALENRWDSHHPSRPEHQTAVTQFRDMAVPVWIKLLTDALRIVLARRPEDGICYGPQISSRQLIRIRSMAKRLFDHPFWQDTELDKALRSDDAAYVAKALDRWGLNHLYLIRS